MPYEIDQVLRDFLMESQDNLQRVDQELIILEQEPENQELIGDVFRAIHSIKGSAGFLKMPRLEHLAHAAEEVLAKVRKGDLRLTASSLTCMLHVIDSLRAILRTMELTGQEGDPAIQHILQHIQSLSDGQIPAPDATIDCPAARIGTLDGPPGTAAESPPSAPEETPSAVPAASRERASGRPLPEAPSHPDESPIESVEDTRVHVDVSVLDHLMNVTGELVLARNQVVRRANDTRDPGWQTIAQRLHSVVADLQETMLKARMQEIHQVFGLFPRLVHDLSQQHGKEVQLRLEGHKTELDRTLLEGLKEPLIHLIRNAIDHGIETPSVRRQHGKPAAGTIRIRAYHDSGQVHIEVTDDGAGIDPERIKHQALALGLLTPEQAAGASTPALLEFIFRPGFSTAATVTNISGRGVGMDVVKRQLNRLGGVIEIATTPDQGTTFHLRLPMTLAIISGLLVSAQDRQFVIPQQHIEELVRLDQERSHDHVIYELAGAEVYRLRGELLPIVRLTTLLNLPSLKSENGRHCEESATKQSPETGEIASQSLAMTAPVRQNVTTLFPGGERGAKQANPHIIVLSTGDRRFGLFVENVSDTEEIVVKPLGQHIKQVPCYDGATILMMSRWHKPARSRAPRGNATSGRPASSAAERPVCAFSDAERRNAHGKEINKNRSVKACFDNAAQQGLLPDLVGPLKQV